MAYEFPLSAENFMDTLAIESCTWDIERYDEYSSQGTGHDIQSELAPPKWMADFGMRALYNHEAAAMAAKVRKLNGSQEAVMIYNPVSPYPFADPKGTILAANTVTISAIGSDNQSVTLAGLPANYVLTIGDKGQIVFASGARNYFFEFSETLTANGSGVMTGIDIWPHIPAGVNVGATVILKKPACKMVLQPRGFAPGRSSGNRTFGTAMKLLEKI